MDLASFIDELQKLRSVIGGHHLVGAFADEFGTWHEVVAVKFVPHQPSNWPDCYSPPPGGGVMFDCSPECVSNFMDDSEFKDDPEFIPGVLDALNSLNIRK